MLKEALYYKALHNNIVKCYLCPHHCKLKVGQKGSCQVRYNENGKLYTQNYANVSSLALDPIEKKPLYHFFPSKMILSAGTYGCNLSCNFCQNHTIAQEIGKGPYITPNEMLAICLNAQAENSVGLAFTYNEPTIWYEYILEMAQLLKENHLKVALITNGYIETKPLEKLLPFIDAFNIDLKGFTNSFYQRNCKAQIDPVKNVIEKVAGKAHLEITTLLIPDENDDIKEMESLASYIASINPDIPLHLSRYFPAYKLKKLATPLKTMEISKNIACEYLKFVYLGNMVLENNTYCQNCKALLIKRDNYNVDLVNLQGNKCSNCGIDVEFIKNS